jgi:hypothetical protein
MDGRLNLRMVMVALGAGAGLCLHLLMKLAENEVISPRLGLGLIALAAMFFAGVLGMAGPLPLRRAAPGALAVAVLVAGLLVLGSLRFAGLDAYFDTALPFLTGFALWFVPLPFLIARENGGWRDYPRLFGESWGMVVRYAAAWIFVGVVFLMIWLSDTLLNLVGIGLIGDLLGIDAIRLMMIGGMLGLGLAVLNELSDMVAPDLVLRLLRILLPAVLVVVAVFIAALPFRGLSGLFGGLSAAATLMTMSAVAATLVTTAIDRRDDEGATGPVMTRAAQGMALIMPVLGGLSLWAVAQRVADYGWTPDRVLAAVIAALTAGYGVVYAVAVLRGPGWRERIRQGNIRMALAVVGVAALLLTPVLNPERISANSQLARLTGAGATPTAGDLAGLSDWGHAGAELIERLEAHAREPGQEALAAALQAAQGQSPVTPEIRQALAAAITLQPPGAAPLRDAVLAALTEGEVADWRRICQELPADGEPRCVMAVADFLPDVAGEEVIAFLRDRTWARIEGFAVAADGVRRPEIASVLAGARLDPAFPDLDQARSIMGRLARGLPPLQPVTTNHVVLEGFSIGLRP